MSFPRLARWLMAPMAGIALAAAIIAGGGGVAFVQPAAVAQAADATARVAGADVALSAQVRLPASSQTVTMAGNGYESLAQRSGQLSLRLAGTQSAAGAAPRFTMRFVYPLMFMRSPLLQRRLPAGKQWIKIDLARAMQQQGIDPTAMSSSQADPAEYLGYLRAVAGRVQDVGRDTVRGVPTTHYRAKCDLRRYARLAAPAERAAAAQSITRLIALTGADTLPVDVWIDRHHLVRRLRVLLSFKMPSGALAGQRITEQITTDLYDFGPKPAVSPPPADQTYDITKLAAAAARAPRS